MNRPAGILFHELGGVFGWGEPLRRIDVARIKEMDYHRRLFRISQRDLPWTLEINYYHPHETMKMAPTLTSRGGGFTFHSSINLYTTITTRYPSEKKLLEEKKTIEYLIAKLDNYGHNKRIEILD